MKIRKPAFLIALALCLVTALFVPQAALTAEAASVVNISSAAGLAKALTDSKSAAYKLTADISGIKKEIRVTGGTKTLDLNGHSIKGSSIRTPYFWFCYWCRKPRSSRNSKS